MSSTLPAVMLSLIAGADAGLDATTFTLRDSLGTWRLVRRDAPIETGLEAPARPAASQPPK